MSALQRLADTHEAETLGDDTVNGELTAAPAESAPPEPNQPGSPGISYPELRHLVSDELRCKDTGAYGGYDM